MIFADFARAGLPVRAIPMSLPDRAAEDTRRTGGSSQCKAGERIANRPGRGEEEGWQKPRKGRFCGGNEFCNWLYNESALIAPDGHGGCVIGAMADGDENLRIGEAFLQSL